MDNAPSAPKFMSLHLLEEITNGFSKKLGGGAYGNVYLGEHKDGEKIAVKVLKDDLDHLDNEQFDKEYHNLASLHHKNVVRLVGYCNETEREFVQHDGRYVPAEKTKRVLCFEYMHNGSLDKFISDESDGYNWRTRYAIIKGICEGLEYLHEKLETPLLHLDLKPANVLLDENMSPKIADFGISRLLEKTKKTNSAIGTHGYIPPEFIDAALISTKFDIYSLGVVIIKIMAGKDGYFRSAENSSQQFIELVHTDWMNRLQATSVYMYSIQVRRCIEIALSCVEDDRRKRPNIGEIVNNLNATEFTSQILDALRNGLDKRIFTWSRLPFKNGWLRSNIALTPHEICPCISNEREMLKILKKKLISYRLNVTDNRGMEHEATVTTVGDPAGDTSTFEPVKPRIKIIDCTNGLGGVIMIDAHSTEPWILVGHKDRNVSIWNHQNQTRVMAFHNIGGQGEEKIYLMAAKFIEPLQCFLLGDNLGYIHVYSYVTVDKLQRFRAHAGWVSSLAVHPSEAFVLSTSADKLIKLWTWETGWQCIRTFEGHSGFVYQVKFNPQTAGNTFVSSSSDSTLKIWNIHSATPVATLDSNSKYHTCLDYFIPSGDRQYVVTGSGYGNAEIWDLQTNTSIKHINGLQKCGCNIAVVEGILGHPVLLTVSEDNTFAFCDSDTHRYENRVNFNLGSVWNFAYISMIKSLAVGCERGIVIMEID